MGRVATGVLTGCLTLVAAVVAPVAQASPPPAGVEFTPAPIVWTPCETEGLAAAGAECGSLVVPLDHDEPGGTTIELAVSRVLHTVPDVEYQGVMLVNPGGPGASGLPFSQLGGLVPNGAGDSYDWIGFDPRGVGSSEPALTCIPDYAGFNRPDYRPEAGTEQVWLERSRAYAEACAMNGGALLDHLTTEDTVLDMDIMRRALGQEQINFFGFSYGSYLGQVYGTLFPDRLRRVVLDGVVDTRKIWYESNLEQDIDFERNIEVFFDWVAKYDSVYGLGNSGDDIEALYYEQLDALSAIPAAGKVGAAEWNDLFVPAAYGVFSYEDTAQAFADWIRTRDGEALAAAYEASVDIADDNGYALYLAVLCTDVQWPQDYDEVRDDNVRVDKEAPFLTWANAWFNGPCNFWPGEVSEPVEIDGGAVADMLLISETFDAATSYEGALQTRRDFPNSVLIEGVGGTTHSGSLSGVACTDDLIADYLATGALPERVAGDDRSDVQCEPVPQPDPTAPEDGEE